MLTERTSHWAKQSLVTMMRTTPNPHLHELRPDRLNVVVEEVRLEIVHAQLQGTKALADQSLRAVEGRHQRIHEHGQVGQQGAQTHWHGQAQLYKQILHVLLVKATLQHVQT